MSVKDICFGVGFILLFAGASGMDAPDITANVICIAIGLGLMLVGNDFF